MTIKAGHQWPAFIVMILFWFYFSGLHVSNRILRIKIQSLETGVSLELNLFINLQLFVIFCAATWENAPSDKCVQQRLKSVCEFAQSDQKHFG